MKLARLTKVELREQWKDEAKDFTPWLAAEENISLLAETLGLELEVIGQEEKVGQFRADILAKDIATDKHVVIENQLEQTDHSHLGQVVTYCAGLQASTFIWVSAQIKEEHRAAVDWLNSISDDDHNFFAVEIQLFRIGDSDVAPNFKVVAKPNGWTKNVKKQVSVEFTDNDMLKLEFWESFRAYVAKQAKTPFKTQKPLPQHWTNVAIGTSAAHINVLIGRQRAKVAVQLILDNDNAKDNFDYLYEALYDKSQDELVKDIEWARLDDKKSSYITASIEGDYHNKSDWQRQFEWLYDMTARYYHFFKPHVKHLK